MNECLEFTCIGRTRTGCLVESRATGDDTHCAVSTVIDGVPFCVGSEPIACCQEDADFECHNAVEMFDAGMIRLDAQAEWQIASNATWPVPAGYTPEWE